MTRSLAALFVCLIASPSHALSLDCSFVRAFVAQHGKAVAIAYALKNGASWPQIKEAEKCLTPPIR